MMEPVVDTYSDLCKMFKAAGISETKFFFKNEDLMNRDEDILNFYAKETKEEPKDKKDNKEKGDKEK